MSSSATPARRARFIDTIGILAVVASLFLGLVPGIGLPVAQADDSCEGLTRENGGFTVNRVLLELDSQEDSDSEVDLVVDTIDENVKCSVVSNSLRITLKTFNGQTNVDLKTDSGADAPDFHMSCSEDFANYTITIDGVAYDVVYRVQDITNKGNYTGACEPFPYEPSISLTKVAVDGDGSNGSDLVGGELAFTGANAHVVQTALYSYTITNDGNEALTLQSLGDDRITGLDLGDTDCPVAPETLDPDDSCTATATEDFTYDQALAAAGDADGAIVNTANVVGVGVNSAETVTADDSASITYSITYSPSILVDKVAVDGESGNVSDLADGGLAFTGANAGVAQTALYSYLITNDGDEALTLNSLSDDRITGLDLGDTDCPVAPDTFDPGDTCTAEATESFTHAQAVTADTDADGDIVNTATVEGVGVNSSETVTDDDPATITYSILYSPDVLVEKAAVDGDGSNGSDLDGGNLGFTGANAGVEQTALYSYTITNTGDEPLNLTSLSDDRITGLDLTDSNCPAELAVGAACTATATESFTHAQAVTADTDEDGEIFNTVTVDGVGVNSAETVTDDDDASITYSIVYDPSISVAKTAVNGDGSNGSDLVGGELAFTGANAEVEQTALYSYLITNDGDEALTLSSLGDDRITGLDLGDTNCPVAPDTLDPGESCTAEATEDFTHQQALDADTDADGEIVNTANVEGVGVNSAETVTDDDDASITYSITYSPDISLTKTAVDSAEGNLSDLVGGELAFTGANAGVEQTALYSYLITNTGDEALTLTSLSDDRITGLDLTDTDCPAELAVGAACTATATEDFTYDQALDADTNKDGEIFNTATVVGEGVNSGKTVTENDLASITYSIVYDPSISLTKTAVNGDGSNGSDLVGGELAFTGANAGVEQTALYSYLITNTGDEALSLTSLSDDRLGTIALTSCADPLPVGGTCTVTGTEDFTHAQAVTADPEDGADDGTIVNTATVVGEGVNSEQTVTDVDDASITYSITYSPDISLVKTAVDSAEGNDSDLESGNLGFTGANAGVEQTALYGYTITNTGDEALSLTSLSDDRVGTIALTSCADPLLPGVSCTVTGTEAFTHAQAVTADPEDGADDGTIVNTANVTGVGVNTEQTVTDDDDASITYSIVYDPSISLTKTAVDSAEGNLSDLIGGELAFTGANAGVEQTALYSYLITNTGDEALSLTSLSDDRLGTIALTSCADPLPVGATCTVTGTEDFTHAQAVTADPEDGADDGTIVNTATVTGVGVNTEQTVTDVDDASITYTIVYTPDISLVKTAVPAAEGNVSHLLDNVAGDDPYLVFSPEDDEGPKTALYSYTITNTGDEHLSLTSLSDNRLGTIPLTSCADPLLVGATCTVTATEDFELANAPATDITNEGTVIATGANSEEQVSDKDDAVIDLRVTYDPDISLVKTAVPAAGGNASDLLDDVAGDDPYLVFSPVDDEGPKTALYSYVITNTGDEPLSLSSLSDDRVPDVGLGDCPAELAVGATCTVTATEDFGLTDAPATDVANEGTVAAVGTKSQEQVTDKDDAVIDLRVTYDPDISLVKTAVTTDGFSDGDLIADPGGFPFLSFTSSDQGPKAAVFEYLITNTGDVTLEDVALVDDRLGAIDLAGSLECQTLEPGESCTARGSEQFDYDDATGSLASLITNVGTVTATGGGEDVSDSDDATITLVAVQSSILIDLTKDVVAGEGDVEEFDGLPIASWTEEEYEDGVSKTVRYRFTVTNISNSPITDVELLDPMVSDQPLIAKADGVTLQPGESTVVEVDHQLTVGEAFPDGPIGSKVDNVATVSGANETRDSFSEASDDASVFTEIVFAKVLEQEEPLPATGLDSSGLLPVSMLLITIGAAILWLDRRRVARR